VFGGAESAAVANGVLTQAQADELMMRRFRPFATGGIVTSPTLGLVGEAGAEAIIPLSKLGNMGNNINITVNAGLGVDGAEVGNQIIDAIKKAERRSGKVFASA
jgi:phage-related minor tail protein